MEEEREEKDKMDNPLVPDGVKPHVKAVGQISETGDGSVKAAAPVDAKASAAMDKNVSSAPHQLTVINDYTKTVITLASGLLAVTVTFSSQLLGTKSLVPLIFLFVSWILLVAAIGFALTTAAYTSVYLGLAAKDNLDQNEEAKKKSRFERSISFCSYSFYCLLLAASIFVGIGATRILSRPKECSEAAVARQGREFVSSVHGAPPDKLFIESLDWDSSANTYTLVFREAENSNKYSVTFDARACKIVRSRGER